MLERSVVARVIGVGFSVAAPKDVDGSFSGGRKKRNGAVVTNVNTTGLHPVNVG